MPNLLFFNSSLKRVLTARPLVCYDILSAHADINGTNMSQYLPLRSTRLRSHWPKTLSLKALGGLAERARMQ